MKAVDFYEKKMDFGGIGELYETLHDGWNNGCEPMLLHFQTIQLENSGLIYHP